MVPFVGQGSRQWDTDEHGPGRIFTDQNKDGGLIRENPSSSVFICWRTRFSSASFLPFLPRFFLRSDSCSSLLLYSSSPTLKRLAATRSSSWKRERSYFDPS